MTTGPNARGAAGAALRLPPHPKDDPVLGSLMAFRADTMQAFVDGWRQLGDVVRFRGPRTMILVAHPDHVGQVLEDPENYPRSPFVTGNLRPIMGEGLYRARGDAWHRQHRLVRPLFDHGALPRYAASVTDSTEAAMARWTRDVRPGAPLDVPDEMTRLALDATRTMLLGQVPREEAERFNRAVITTVEYAIPKVMALANPPDRLRPRHRSFRGAQRDLDAILHLAVQERRAHPTGDITSALVAARDVAGGTPMTDREVVDELRTVVFGVYKSVPHALVWLWRTLSQHPEVRRRLEGELSEVLAGRTPTVDDLPRLRYATMVVQEVLRLSPPLWVTPRHPQRDAEIGGFHVPAGVALVISPYITHRHPGFWTNPEGFDPERFAPERDAERHPYAYLPFTGGPRACTADALGMMHLQLVLATVAQHHRLRLVAGHPIVRRREFVLRPVNGMPMTLAPVPDRRDDSSPSGAAPPAQRQPPAERASAP